MTDRMWWLDPLTNERAQSVEPDGSGGVGIAPDEPELVGGDPYYNDGWLAAVGALSTVTTSTLWSNLALRTILRFGQRNDGRGSVEGNGRLGYYQSSAQDSNRILGNGQGAYE